MAVLGLLCGCSDDDDVPKRESAQLPPQRCELEARDKQVFVRLTGTRARDLCADWSQPGAPGDWIEPSAPADPDQDFNRVCVLYRGRSAAGLYAADSISSVARAKRFCTRLLQDGWGELGRPDPALAEEYPAPNTDSAGALCGGTLPPGGPTGGPPCERIRLCRRALVVHAQSRSELRRLPLPLRFAQPVTIGGAGKAGEIRSAARARRVSAPLTGSRQYAGTSMELAGLEPATSWVRFGRPLRANSANLQGI